MHTRNVLAPTKAKNNLKYKQVKNNKNKNLLNKEYRTLEGEPTYLIDENYICVVLSNVA